ncbi:hypothetical protein COEX109129_28910 [Corallococcus exiguus]
MGPERMGRADDGAQVVRILDAVEHDDERGLLLGLRHFQHVLQFDVLEAAQLGDDALVHAALGHGGQPFPADLLHPDARVTRAAEQFARGLGANLPVNDEEALHRVGMGAQGLQHGVDAMDVARGFVAAAFTTRRLGGALAHGGYWTSTGSEKVFF